MLIALCSAGCTVCLVFSLIVLARPADVRSPRLWLAVLFAEQFFAYASGLCDALLGPELVSALVASLDGLYGMPALYLFARAVLKDPAPRPVRHFLPAIVCASSAVVLCGLYAASGWQATEQTYYRFWVLEGCSWLVETAQFFIYGILTIRRLAEPRRPFAGLTQARSLAVVVLLCYGIIFVGSWSLFAFDGVLRIDWELLENPISVASYALMLPCAVLLALLLASKPWLLFEDFAFPPELTQDPKAQANTEKYAKTPLLPQEAQALLALARSYMNGCKDLSESALTPKKLAQALAVPYHRLSRASNEAGGISLPLLIADTRLD